MGSSCSLCVSSEVAVRRGQSPPSSVGPDGQASSTSPHRLVNGAVIMSPSSRIVDPDHLPVGTFVPVGRPTILATRSTATLSSSSQRGEGAVHTSRAGPFPLLTSQSTPPSISSSSCHRMPDNPLSSRPAVRHDPVVLMVDASEQPQSPRFPASPHLESGFSSHSASLPRSDASSVLTLTSGAAFFGSPFKLYGAKPSLPPSAPLYTGTTPPNANAALVPLCAEGGLTSADIVLLPHQVPVNVSSSKVEAIAVHHHPDDHAAAIEGSASGRGDMTFETLLPVMVAISPKHQQQQQLQRYPSVLQSTAAPTNPNPLMTGVSVAPPPAIEERPDVTMVLTTSMKSLSRFLNVDVVMRSPTETVHFAAASTMDVETFECMGGARNSSRAFSAFHVGRSASTFTFADTAAGTFGTSSAFGFSSAVDPSSVTTLLRGAPVGARSSLVATLTAVQSPVLATAPRMPMPHVVAAHPSITSDDSEN